MDAMKRSKCSKCDADVPEDSERCPRCASSLSKLLRKASSTVTNQSHRVTREESAKIAKPTESSYVTQIVSSGIRPDNVYEAQMFLAPEVDLSSIRITVKGSNLRVNVCKALNDRYAGELARITEKSLLGDLVKRTMKHCENLLIPDGIDNGKVRAVVDSKNRMLVLTAPAIRPSQTRRRYTEKS